MNYQDIQYNTRYGEEYAITLQFELQREKQKNKILEERLRNKQIFIIQMKKMQSQLEFISQKSRAELMEQRQRRQTLQNTTVRQLVQTIAELEHKIKYLEGLEGNKKLSKFDQKLMRNKSASKYLNQISEKQQKKIKQMNINQIQNKKYSYNIHQKQPQNYDVLKNFANRFIQMFSFYNEEIKQDNLKKNLKAGWKWIKQVVKQWQVNQNKLQKLYQYAEKCQQQQNGCDPQLILKLKNNQEDENQEDDT